VAIQAFVRLEWDSKKFATEAPDQPRINQSVVSASVASSY